MHILLERMEGGNVQEFLERNPSKKITDLSQLNNFIRQIVDALVYLNKAKIVHQDLKPENILLTKSEQTVKLCDFGVSNYVDRTRLTQDAKGTLRYMSPELIDGRISSKADVWALGCVIL